MVMPDAAVTGPGSGTIRTSRSAIGLAARTAISPRPPEVTEANTHRPSAVLTAAVGLPSNRAVTGWIAGSGLPVVTLAEHATLRLMPVGVLDGCGRGADAVHPQATMTTNHTAAAERRRGRRATARHGTPGQTVSAAIARFFLITLMLWSPLGNLR